MTKISIGCAGWEYKDWTGPFYPKTIERSDHLSYYSKFFDIVEINSTFYNLPSQEMVYSWSERTPQDFRFIVKMWQEITHKTDSLDMLESHYINFNYTIQPLKKKLAGILIQFPPHFSYSEINLNVIKFLLNLLSSDFRYFIELRHESWYKDKVLVKLVDSKNKILTTSYIPDIRPFYLHDQDFYYIRLIGDRELTIFNQIQRDQSDSLEQLREKVENLIKKSEVKEIFIIVNNHFAGFGPASANLIKKMFNLRTIEFSFQRKLTEFF